MHFGTSLSNARRLLAWTAVFCAATLIVSPANARPFHLWTIQEIYSNSSGTLQFIEMTDAPPVDFFGGQNSVNFQSIISSNSPPYSVPATPTLGGNTLGHMLLFGTAGIQAAGGPAPDFPIPDNFLSTSGGTISFFGANGGAYGVMPTDGLLSVNWSDGTMAINSPTNYQGQTGTVIPVPEPSTLVLTPLAIALGGLLRRRRAAKSRSSQPRDMT